MGRAQVSRTTICACGKEEIVHMCTSVQQFWRNKTIPNAYSLRKATNKQKEDIEEQLYAHIT